jgi:hypothetical protein
MISQSETLLLHTFLQLYKVAAPLMTSSQNPAYFDFSSSNFTLEMITHWPPLRAWPAVPHVGASISLGPIYRWVSRFSVWFSSSFQFSWDPREHWMSVGLGFLDIGSGVNPKPIGSGVNLVLNCFLDLTPKTLYKGGRTLLKSRYTHKPYLGLYLGLSHST